MTRPIRCAIYTRKSTEDGLEQDFNSLDAQREACEAYIRSQVHEGWTLVHGAYDDGGFSGGTMDRPALKRLLDDVAAGKVDTIVVYKVDRLTRSLTDFARIVELLEKHGASFVSVTQAFNTTSSMGRLMLNVLLSFAQFEREVTGERIRDKIAASKRKGMWMGGPVPLGYRVEARKLVEDESSAALVRHIFDRYLVLGSGQALVEELRASGHRTRAQPLRDGRVRGGVPFSRGALFALLANRIYVGEIVHKGVVYPGEHAGIIDRGLWDAVQRRIAANKAERRAGSNVRLPSLLAGVLKDDHGRRMSPSHTVKDGKRYRYYVTHQDTVVTGSPAPCRVSAHAIEAVVSKRLGRLLNDRAAVHALLPADLSGAELASAFASASATATRLAEGVGRKAVLTRVIAGVSLGEAAVTIRLNLGSLSSILNVRGAEEGEHELAAETIRVRHGNDVKLVIPQSDGHEVESEPLADLMREALKARELVLATPEKTIKDIAAEQGQCRFRLSGLLRLSWLAPSIVEAIESGRVPRQMTKRALLKADLPLAWTEQTRMLELS